MALTTRTEKEGVFFLEKLDRYGSHRVHYLLVITKKLPQCCTHSWPGCSNFRICFLIHVGIVLLN